MTDYSHLHETDAVYIVSNLQRMNLDNLITITKAIYEYIYINHKSSHWPLSFYSRWSWGGTYLTDRSTYPEETSRYLQSHSPRDTNVPTLHRPSKSHPSQNRPKEHAASFFQVPQKPLGLQSRGHLKKASGDAGNLVVAANPPLNDRLLRLWEDQEYPEHG